MSEAMKTSLRTLVPLLHPNNLQNNASVLSNVLLNASVFLVYSLYVYWIYPSHNRLLAHHGNATNLEDRTIRLIFSHENRSQSPEEKIYLVLSPRLAAFPWCARGLYLQLCDWFSDMCKWSQIFQHLIAKKGVYIIYKTAENFPEMARTGRKVSKAMKKL